MRGTSEVVASMTCALRCFSLCFATEAVAGIIKANRYDDRYGSEAVEV
jgi:hypothetical protein